MKTMKQIYLVVVMAAVLGTASPSFAAPNQLQAVQASQVGGHTELSLQFNTPVQVPKGFVMQNPPRVVFDFPSVEVNPAVRRARANAGLVKDVKAVNSKGLTRVVVHLKQSADYSVDMQDGNRIVLSFGGNAQAQAESAQTAALPEVALPDSYNYYQNPNQPAPATAQTVQAAQQANRAQQQHYRAQQQQYKVLPRSKPKANFVPYAAPANPVQTAKNNRFVDGPTLRGLDFRRSPNGGGRLILDLPSTDTIVTETKNGSSLTVTLAATDIPSNLRQRLDVTDFATPVSNLQVSQGGGNGAIIVNGATAFSHRVERQGSRYTLYVDPVKAEADTADGSVTTTQVTVAGGTLGFGGKAPKTFTGEKLSLNFQDIEVRAVLQLLADFTDKNIVVSDTVQGNITVRLKDVPWDQALDIVLETKNLGMRENGNVIWIAPQAEMSAKDELVMQATKRKVELEPLITEYIPINFAKATDLANLIQQRSTDKAHSLLSERGNVSVDERTNTLLIQDTASRVQDIRSLIKALDIPVQQVLIESRIVTANDEFGKELGAKFGANPKWKNKDSSGIGVGNLNGAADYSQGKEVSLNDALSVNLPVTGAAGSFGFAILAKDFMLELELSALQSESRGEVIATPRVITSNQTKAIIEQGVEIPYLQDSSSGATNVSFKKAVLSLEVTPQITPDEHISMDLKVNQDTVGELFKDIPSINTREIQTRVMVSNGQTVVLGGVHEEVKLNGVTKVPVLGDLPVVGQMFRKTTGSDKKRELLIFVTPKIVESTGKR